MVPTPAVFYNHEGDTAQINANASYQNDSFTAFGIGLQGGMTMTAKGAALHRMQTQGGTRMLVDTGGVAGVPVRGYGNTTNTNAWGKAVIGDMSNYYRNQASIDLNKLGETQKLLNPWFRRP